MELRRAKIPYVLVGGQSFYDRKEVRDVLAYLKVLAHPDDEPSLMRIINVPARGIGQTTVKRLLEEAIRRGKPLGDVLGHAGSVTGLSDAAVQAVARFQSLLERFRRKIREKPLADVLKTLIAEIAYKEELARQYSDANEREARWASVEELVNAAAGYSQRAARGAEKGTGTFCAKHPEGRSGKMYLSPFPPPTLAGFLQDVALAGSETEQDKESKLERNAVALMTLHAAKGLEFSEVYMVGMEEGTLPHHRSVADANNPEKGTGAICRDQPPVGARPEGASHNWCPSPFPGGDAVDEERRLCYVGVTRARRRLTLTMALSRRKWGKPRPTHPSRFLYELTGRADNPNYQAAKACP
jgi:DNA helicase-2/ATP-dependent DNA helicase PcrA